MAFTSSILLFAMNRCLLFICDVFFLGTARSIPSHISETSEGIDIAVAGDAIDTADDRNSPAEVRSCLERSSRKLLRPAAIDIVAIAARMSNQQDKLTSCRTK